ncbi:Calcineurin-like phosphoesterase [Neorhodopirellula lusitana]|uniref:Calcineurin-like phosphoesterase n=1 Tax=Neorhodopirellula lusitana TaxID=445327 RepID=A0ABY1PRJ2_9BACT|nr:metallophosphoesterase family protein [Neorhodopirellula lusitana]SMP41472.1 Calcineurin-like phosphoesterase [Neorhodopirellula lusitana]
MKRNKCTHMLILGIFCSLMLGSRTATAAAPLIGTQPAQWRVVWTDDPSTTATVSWSTAAAGKSHTLRFRVKGTDESPSAQLAESGRYTGGESELYYHHVRLTELQPATAYEVQMISDADQSPVFYFVTAPSTDREFSILHGGDSRSDHKVRRRVNKMIASLVASSYDNNDLADDILAFAHGGDYVVTGTKMDLWSAWLSDHELTAGPDGRLLPVIPARGNHDKGKPFNEVFGFPDEDLNYYGISIGPQVRFTTLNSETSTAGDQAKWLKVELKESRASHRWLLAQYHRPVYPAVKTPGPGLKSWVPLFEKYNVDLVCEADGHNIKRTVPIRDGVKDETGVVYIGEGGLGVPQRTPKPERWFLNSPGMADKGHHVFVLKFTQEALQGTCLLEDGTVRDQFIRKPRQ